MTNKVQNGGKVRVSNDGAHVLKTQRFVRISHNRHTGRYLPLHYTSYAVVFFLLILLGSILLFTRLSVVDAGPPQTQSGDIALSGVVPGPPPSSPPTIGQPAENQHFNSALITISGSCESGYIIEVYRNGVLAGSDMCASGQYEIPITLTEGDNQIVVRIKDSIGQYGPDSPTIIVTYDVPQEQNPDGDDGSPTPSTSEGSDNSVSSGEQVGTQLLLFTKSLHTGGVAGQTSKISYKISGGIRPYAVSVDWDDDQDNSLISVKSTGQKTAEHIYKQPGQYTVTFFATDSQGATAQIQTIVIITATSSGTTTGAPANTSGGTTQCDQNSGTTACIIQAQLLKSIDVVWPAFVVASLMGISFWFGEKAILFSLARTGTRT